ncbi:inositol monophosphatase [Ilyonectria robusta]|uniref:inositol monophosphatase n=1 Tax=Ilyonectria robusta TaxID=1079257 RepID=UPI001E8ED175|nr:inositol monophosphatase [Ilyonectria robusta]KAH8736268.1 inositol monophosphatase [Ilyonectria robusta]
MDDKELAEIYAFAVQLGKDAGDMLMAAARRRMDGSGDESSSSTVSYVEKENSVDIVTKTDNDVEHFIRTSVEAKYPDHGFLGEESYSAGASRTYLVDDRPTWIVDPLDGTVNFTHLFPMFCVSIAFAVKGVPIIGVINAPFLHQSFSSCVGKGAWLNGTQRLPLIRNPTPPMPHNAPSGCTFSCEWGKDRRDIPDGNMTRKVESFVNMASERGGRGGKGGMVHGMRSLGSATLDLAYTAMGSFDIWWEGGCWEWDVAAGFAILEEAGGLITTANPPEDPETADIPTAHLGGRLYLAIRPAGPSEKETGRQSQERTVREVWKRVRHLDYKRPGAET